MRKAGEVTYVDAHNRMGKGTIPTYEKFLKSFSLGRGEACYSTRDEMYRALDTLQGTVLNGREIKLSIKASKYKMCKSNYRYQKC